MMRNLQGNTPLHLAVNTSHIPVVEYLLRQGALVNARNTVCLNSVDFLSFVLYSSHILAAALAYFSCFDNRLFFFL